ncbi:MAG: hypothetical protein HY731_07750 [Candidatus Tectomicrobia bacterium]|nr:hypothetical protein [Candidatus Tectomicrobia bacterium]
MENALRTSLALVPDEEPMIKAHHLPEWIHYFEEVRITPEDLAEAAFDNFARRIEVKEITAQEIKRLQEELAFSLFRRVYEFHKGHRKRIAEHLGLGEKSVFQARYRRYLDRLS